ncbi:MAG: hypothetical protein ACJ8GN_15105 [Longimicrobiaceae bacterium]
MTSHLLPLTALLLAVATGCSAESTPRQETTSFADTTSVRIVAPERPPAMDTGAEPDTAPVRVRTIVEEPPSTARRPRQTRSTAPRSSTSRVYYRGPKGGCYTYSASGRKRYVDHSFCR